MRLRDPEREKTQRLVAFEVLNNPIWWSEMLWRRQGEKDPITGDYWKAYPCRVSPMLATRHNENIFDGSGRNQSKSEQIKAIEVWGFFMRSLMAGRPRQGMFLSPHKVHAKSLSSAVYETKRDPLFKSFIVRVKEQPEFEVNFVDGSILYGVIPGVNGGNLAGHHVDEIIYEEACWFTKKQLSMLGGCMNPTCTQHAYGTKNGDRSCPMWEVDQTEKFNYYRRYAIPSTAHPHYKKLRPKLIERYGAPGSHEWKQNVLAEWGQPVNWAWNETDIEKCWIEDPEFEHVELTEKHVLDPRSKDGKYKNVEEIMRLPRNPKRFDTVLAGWDVGYQDDSEMTFWGSNDGGKFRLFFRMTIKKVRVEYQLEILDRLCQAMSTKRIGIDVGGAGQLAADLLTNDRVKGLTFRFKDRVSYVDYGSSMVLGKDENDEDINKNVKEYCVEYTGRLLYNNAIEIPDELLGADMRGYNYTIGGNNRYVYKKTDDHAVVSLLSFAKAHYDTYVKPDTKKRKLKYAGIIPVFAAA